MNVKKIIYNCKNGSKKIVLENIEESRETTPTLPLSIEDKIKKLEEAKENHDNLIDTLVLPNILQNTTDIEMLKLEKLK
ncbi:hypothetical protein GW965_07955 [Clostridium perfringens]|nr:hypothetical protein [Clostridium perfringens]